MINPIEKRRDEGRNEHWRKFAAGIGKGRGSAPQFE
jgi:hypothetical protein